MIQLLVIVLLGVLSLCTGQKELLNFDTMKFSNLSEISKLNIEDLVKELSHQPGMEFLNDPDLLKSLGYDDISRIDPEVALDARLLTPGLIQRRGYPVETHQFQSTDGYIIEMHRIPGSPFSPPAHGKQPVLLMHGILDTSATWVLMGPEQGLGYLLADHGYDVWLGNARGNRYSRNHVQHDPDGWRGNRRRFWAFSWHEIGVIDVPNMIDYITSRTGFHRMHYIGHSQGTTVFFVMASQRPEYNDRIISAHQLAPIAYMENIRNIFLRMAVQVLNTADIVTSVLGVYEFLPNSYVLGLLGQSACRDEAWTQVICSNVIFLIGGFNSQQLNNTMIPVIMGHTPAGSSTDQTIHYGQLIQSGFFRRYDHGLVSNLLEYGTARPPSYNLGNVRAPVALYYSHNDWLSDAVDVLRLQRELPNVIDSFIPDPRFNHFDFIWGISARPLLYNRILSTMRLYDGRGKSGEKSSSPSEKSTSEKVEENTL